MTSFVVFNQYLTAGVVWARSWAVNHSGSI